MIKILFLLMTTFSIDYCFSQEINEKAIEKIDQEYKFIVSSLSSLRKIIVNDERTDKHETVKYYRDTTLIMIVEKTIEEKRHEKIEYLLRDGEIIFIVLHEFKNDAWNQEINSNHVQFKIYYELGEVIHIVKIFGEEDKEMFQSYFDSKKRLVIDRK